MSRTYDLDNVSLRDRYVGGSPVDSNPGGGTPSGDVLWDEVLDKPTEFPPEAHKTDHENGGGDEISIAGLSGEAADPQVPKAHGHGYHIHVSLTTFTASPERDSEYNFHGFLQKIVNAGAVSNGSPLSVDASLGKLLIVVNAGADLAGTLTVTGTSVNRNTAAETGSDTDTITVDAVTTDTSSTDAEGNVLHAFAGAYITSKWFKDTVSISTTNLDLSDVDVWMVAFEQFNDDTDLTVDTLDVTVKNTAVGAPNEWMYAYLYALEVTGSKADITRIASLSLNPTPNAGPYRLRKGLIAKVLDGTTDGVWLDVFFGPTVVNEWENLNTKIWVTLGETSEDN